MTSTEDMLGTPNIGTAALEDRDRFDFRSLRDARRATVFEEMERLGLDALILSNPWTIEQDDAPPPPEALRDHYRRRLADPRAILRLLSGKVSPAKLLASLRDALRPAPPPPGLAQEMAAGIADFAGDVRFLVAERDRTAQAFLAAWDRTDPRIRRCPEASHSYVEAPARDWLAAQVIEILRR